MNAPVAACVKWVDLRPEVDPVLGTIAPSSHGWGFSPADLAATEVALRLAEAWSTSCVVVCAGPPNAAGALGHLAARGAHAAVLVEQPDPSDPDRIAEDLAAVLGPGDLAADAVVCGDLGYDRGSGAVPALLAHRLGLAQALGLVEVGPAGAEGAEVVRRLDGARRERLRVPRRCVLSVEGAVADLRRSSLQAALGREADVEVGRRTARLHNPVEAPRTRPLRPRARAMAAPEGDALTRIMELTDAVGDRTPPRTVEAKPADAAAMILDQLREWGYLEPGRDAS